MMLLLTKAGPLEAGTVIRCNELSLVTLNV